MITPQLDTRELDRWLSSSPALPVDDDPPAPPNPTPPPEPNPPSGGDAGV